MPILPSRPSDLALQLGRFVRAERRRQGLRQEELALLAGVNRRFLGELERGKPTVRLNALAQVLQALGIRVEVKSPATPE